MKHLAIAATVVLLAALSFGSDDVHTIVQRSVEANAADWKAAPEYECHERDQEPGGGTKTYEDLMIMGSPYQRIVAENGKPLSQQEQEQQQKKLDATINQRRNESNQQMAERIAKYEKNRRRNDLLMQQLIKAFDFTLAGEQKVDGHDVYVLKATPRPGYQPPNTDTEVLKGMEGTLWIDKQTFQWVKVEAHVIHPVSIEGFLAKVEPGTRFELEKMPVGNDVWLPKHFSMKAHAKVFFFFSHNSQEDDTYFGYRKATGVHAEPGEARVSAPADM